MKLLTDLKTRNLLRSKKLVFARQTKRKGRLGRPCETSLGKTSCAFLAFGSSTAKQQLRAGFKRARQTFETSSRLQHGRPVWRAILSGSSSRSFERAFGTT